VTYVCGKLDPSPQPFSGVGRDPCERRRFWTLALWLAAVAAVAALGVRGAFVAAPGEVPYPIAVGFGVPLVAFVVAFWVSSAFRDFLITVDLPLTSALQAWRFAGLGFVALHVHNVLPGAFAWPAGLGDIAIGLTAPWVAMALIRRPRFVASRTFVIWNLLGILDLFVAVGTGALSQLFTTGAAGEVTTTPMAQMPLVLIPAFLVPFFVMLHVTALYQAKDAANGAAFYVGPRSS
jgi:hypothetical protein